MHLNVFFAAAVVAALLVVSGATAEEETLARSLIVQVDAAHVDEVVTLVARRGGSTTYAVGRDAIAPSDPVGVTLAVRPSARSALTSMLGLLSAVRSADDGVAQIDEVRIEPHRITARVGGSKATAERFAAHIAADPYLASRHATVRTRGEGALEIDLDPATGLTEALLSGVPANRTLASYTETVADAAVKAGLVGTFTGPVERVTVEGSPNHWYRRVVRFAPCTLQQVLVLMQRIEAKGRVVVTGIAFRIAALHAQQPGVARIVKDVEVAVGAAHRPWQR